MSSFYIAFLPNVLCNYKVRKKSLFKNNLIVKFPHSNTIVSGAVAERVRFSSYCLLTFLITILYSIGCGWMWGEHGWLRNIGCVDLSGGVIHIVGGAAGLACTIFLGPRIGRFDKGSRGVGTAVATWGAGFAGILFSMSRNKGKVDVFEVISGIVSALSEKNLNF